MFSQFHPATKEKFDCEVEIYVDYLTIMDITFAINRNYETDCSHIKQSALRSLKRYSAAIDSIVWC